MSEIRCELPGLSVAGRAWGPDEGRRVLALHGWLDNAGSFDRLAPELEGCRVVAVDLPGHGRSGHLPEGWSFHFSGWLTVVDAILGELGWDRCVLMGHSMGAGIASLYASAMPERVDALVLLEGLAPLSSPASDAPARARRALTQDRHAGRKRARVYPTREEAVARHAAAVPSLDARSRDAILSRGIAQVDGGWAYTHDLRLRTTSIARFTEPQVLSFLSAIACPTLIVRARDGMAFPEAMVAARVGAIPDARVVEIDGGHHNHLTHAGEVGAAARSFLSALPPRET